jgi:hypothetical protein
MGAIAAWGAYSKLGIHAEQISRSLDSVVGLAIGAIASFLFAGILLGYALGVRHSR